MYYSVLFEIISFSDDDDAVVDMICVSDGGSQPKCAQVSIHSVYTNGVPDSGTDEAIIGGALFCKVAAVAMLKKRVFLKTNKTPPKHA